MTKQEFHLSDYAVRGKDRIRDAVSRIDRNAKGIALVLSEDGSLHGTITDGDVRRAMLDGLSLDDLVSALLSRRAGGGHPPVIASVESARVELIDLMREHSIRQVPLIDAQGGIAGLAVLDELLPPPAPRLQAVIMAGGEGIRLRPLTEDCPKPMLPVGDRPLMERTLERLQASGIRRVSIATRFQADQIKEHFGAGEAVGLDIDYITEDRPLGTAGALSGFTDSTEPLLVMNGDIMTAVDFRALHDFHREQKADLTVAVREYDLSVPYGVVETDGAMVTGLAEKPSWSVLINAGLYIVGPRALKLVPQEQRVDMTDLIDRAIEEELAVISFPILEYWIDIGQLPDYEQVQKDVQDGRL